MQYIVHLVCRHVSLSLSRQLRYRFKALVESFRVMPYILVLHSRLSRKSRYTQKCSPINKKTFFKMFTSNHNLNSKFSLYISIGLVESYDTMNSHIALKIVEINWVKRGDTGKILHHFTHLRWRKGISNPRYIALYEKWTSCYLRLLYGT